MANLKFTPVKHDHKAFLAKAASVLPEGDVKAINRYSEAGYATGRVFIEAIKRCGAGLTRDCLIAEIEKTKDFETGVMAPISFGSGKRFSDQKVQIMQADFATLSYKPVQ